MVEEAEAIDLGVNSTSLLSVTKQFWNNKGIEQSSQDPSAGGEKLRPKY